MAHSSKSRTHLFQGCNDGALPSWATNIIKDMVCNNCRKGKIVLHAFSHGECEKCETEIHTSHIPCDKLCESCSDKYDLCKECGNENGPVA